MDPVDTRRQQDDCVCIDNRTMSKVFGRRLKIDFPFMQSFIKSKGYFLFTNTRLWCPAKPISKYNTSLSVYCLIYMSKVYRYLLVSHLEFVNGGPTAKNEAYNAE